MKQIDLNCDMGESTSHVIIGDDAAVMPWISSANIACGYHGGDEGVMQATVALAGKYDVAIGAHPSFNDPEGFGRREMQLHPDEVYTLVTEQIRALKKVLGDGGLHHVKPHGALYNMAARIPEYASAIARAVKDADDHLILYGLSGSHLIRCGKEAGLQVCAEVFADRTYQPDGTLTPRSEAGAIIQDLAQSLAQVMMMVNEGKVRAVDGSLINIEAETVCIHGDHAGAAGFAMALHHALGKEGYQIQAPNRYD